uniref:UmuC domain-containing protein n=1 Tax=Plectus sambesii TaxID=2011161 RepID=A0A914WBI1_9BILA
MELNDNKAGMVGLDKDHINAIIRENTNANYQKHQEKRDQRIQERITRNQRLLESFTPEQISAAERRMDALVDEIEQSRDLSRTIVHVDMDAFYAAVEMRDNPDLRNIPMAVGGDHMLSTSNYAARKFGVRAAMPGFIARKLCPQLTIVPCDFDKYRAASKRVQQVFAQYDPDFSMGSLDEAYLDLTDCLKQRSQSDQKQHEHERMRYSGDCLCRLPRSSVMNAEDEVTVSMCSRCKRNETAIRDKVSFGNSVEDVVAEMRFKIEQATGLTASA